jgi:DNA-binding response OmpR family regulator
MSPAAPFDVDAGRVPSVVVVDPQFNSYATLAASARLGKLQLHLRSSGGDAVRLGRRIHVDAWLVAAELDDMSGHDLVELLKGEATEAPVAMVVDALPGRRQAVESAAAAEAGADTALAHPISLADLERLLGMPTEERAREFGGGSLRPFVTLPVGIGAAVIAIAVLMIG